VAFRLILVDDLQVSATRVCLYSNSFPGVVLGRAKCVSHPYFWALFPSQSDPLQPSTPPQRAAPLSGGHVVGNHYFYRLICILSEYAQPTCQLFAAATEVVR
jgi:hypothetical protein